MGRKLLPSSIQHARPTNNLEQKQDFAKTKPGGKKIPPVSCSPRSTHWHRPIEETSRYMLVQYVGIRNVPGRRIQHEWRLLACIQAFSSTEAFTTLSTPLLGGRRGWQFFVLDAGQDRDTVGIQDTHDRHMHNMAGDKRRRSSNVLSGAENGVETWLRDTKNAQR